MEENVINIEISNVERIEAYDKYFIVYFGKQKRMFSYNEIRKITITDSYLNGSHTGFEYKYHFRPIEEFKSRYDFVLATKTRSGVLEQFNKVVLEKSSLDVLNNNLVYPNEVKEDRKRGMSKKFPGTKGWEWMRNKCEHLWMFLMCVPVINIIPFIWYMLCRKHFYY